MAFFDDVGKRITKVGQGVAQSTKNMASVAKWNGAISDEEKTISRLYSEIGERYFNMHREAPEAPLAAMVQAIIDAKERIAQYREQILKIKGIVNCPNCGAEIPYSAAFCNACGYKMPAAQAPAETGRTISCPTCGASMAYGQNFCTSCGAQITYGEAPSAPVSVPPAPAPTAPAEKICPSCGAHLEPDAEFCLQCGQSV